ncbi:MAG TPA: hypothetical protein VF147_16695, partial [Vicinamibacterales bacterium]
LNSFEHTGSRDLLERFSIAIEKLGPIIALVLIIPSAFVLLVGSVAGGYAVAVATPFSVIVLVLRWMLIFVPIAAIIGPMFLPAGDRTNPVRLLLLPIPRSTIYVAQASSALGEVWNVMMLPILIGFPIGLAAGGAFAAALLAIVAGVLLLAVTVGLAALATTLLHLIVRDRRRSELFGVIFILVISVAGLIPGLIDTPRNKTPDGRLRRDRVPAAVEEYGRRAAAIYPTELYVRGTRAAAGGSLATAGVSAVALLATAVFIHGIGFLAFGRVLDGPSTAGSRGRAEAESPWRRIPGLSPGASAVAMAHMRLVTRTTRGRTSLMSPLLMLVMFSALAYRRQGTMDFGSFELQGGLPLAAFVSFIAMIAMLPIGMNQFAVDRAGLTMVLLSPLPEGEYLAGKAVGIGLTTVPMALFCILAVFFVFPSGHGALWLCLPLGVTATYFLVAPAAAIFSAMLPRVADLSSIGNKGNAHGLAGLLGLLSFVVSGVPYVVLVLIAAKLLDRPWLAPVFLLAWCAIAFGLSRILFTVARGIFVSRRENLATLVSRLLLPS